MIIDTDVLIWELRGNPQANAAVHRSIPFSLSVVTYMELVQGMRNRKELNSFIRQLSRWKVEIIQITPEISTRAMMYVEEFSLSHSMEAADALIAATCIIRSDVLLTANDRHYSHIPNIQIEKFIIDPN